jgi:hypothetical protein
MEHVHRQTDRNTQPSNYVPFCIIFSGVRLSPITTVTIIGLLYQHQMIDDGDCEAIGGLPTPVSELCTKFRWFMQQICIKTNQIIAMDVPNLIYHSH